MKSIYICIAGLLWLTPAYSQESDWLVKYRTMALDYNQDVQAAEKNILMNRELEQAAKADYKPKLSGNANFNYTGNPMELSLDLPAFGQPLHFRGREMKCATSLSLTQPVYMGGRIREIARRAEQESNLAVNHSQVVKADICYTTDLRYWSVVARAEVAAVSRHFRQAMEELTQVVRERVDVQLVARNDLLMAEVKLNEAGYQLMQAQNNYEVARMELNSFVGTPFDNLLPVDSLIPAIHAVGTLAGQMEQAANNRAELRMAGDQITIQETALKINDAQYLPQLHLGVEGNYGSPGYDFDADWDPNYAAYLKLNIPLMEWGKRKREKKAAGYRIGMAKDNYSKVNDNISLQVQSAWYSYSQAVAQVSLTENSLTKAKENEDMALEKYNEGKTSIAEVLDARIYHQTAQINYIQSRLNAQANRSEFIRAMGIYQF